MGSTDSASPREADVIPVDSPDRAPTLTGEGQLLVLEDEGVFFTRSRGEVYVFNTAATYLWCALDAGWTAPDLASVCADAWDVPTETATTRIATTLREWWALGYVDSPGPWAPEPLAFDTALRWLVESPGLRDAFRRSPAEVARRLRIDPLREALFLSLDPQALDRQAALLATARHRLSESAVPALPALVSTPGGEFVAPLPRIARARLAQARSRPIERQYRMLSTVFRVRYGNEDQARRVDPALAHLSALIDSPGDVVLDIVETDIGPAVIEDLAPIALCETLDHLTPVIKSLLRGRALARHDFLMEIHAGVVAAGDRCLLLPGPPGSGKSTLTAGLCHAGFTYFSDEVAVLEDDLRLCPVPLGLGVKPGAVAPLSSLWTGVSDLVVHDREDGQRVRYLTLPPDRCAAPQSRLPVGWIVFPTYHPDAKTELRPLSRPEALRRLMRECLVLPAGLDEADVARLVRWLRACRCYELPMSSLSDAVALVRTLCADDGMDVGPAARSPRH